MRQQLKNVREQLREKDGQLRERTEQLTNVQKQLQERDGQLNERTQQLTNVQGQLQERDGRLREKDGQVRQMNQQLTIVRGQLQERDGRLREKDGQVRQINQQLTIVRGQLQERDGRLREKDGQVRQINQQLTIVRGQLQERDGRLREKDGQVRQMNQQLTIVRGQLQEKNEEVSSLEERLRARDQEVIELEASLSTAQQTLQERSRQQTPDWVISRDQIQLTEKCLGSGGWGKVVEGKYCGCTVAIKQTYEVLLKSSPYYRELFEREMNIASRCRHPCLLQFIGATNDEKSPLFVTELMETSLRKLVEEGPLSRSETSVISLDVARALNYLHLKKPRPIIHRDISSANVLLWRQNDQWRGKVSDYGAANFTKATMTACPGAEIYSAPEAFTQHQNLKVF